MTRAILALVGLLVAAAPASAQGNTTEALRQAKTLYENLDVERALLLLRQVVSPSSPFEVTTGQRVEAYKYLGASLAFMGLRDSAVVYFRAALERDPFTDLDPQTFAPDQVAAFAAARRLTFSVGARAVTPARLHPRAESLIFTVFTTHAGFLRAKLEQDQDSTALVLFDAENDGLRDLRWSGLVAGGRLAPAGRYHLTVRGVSQSTKAVDSTAVYFDVAYEHAPLEDTLPDLQASDLLPEQRPSAPGRRELLAGIGVAVTALVMSTVVADGSLAGRGSAFAAAVGGGGALAGIIGFVWRGSHRTITANVAENQRRQEERTVSNREARRRNEEKLAQTALRISPVVADGLK